MTGAGSKLFHGSCTCDVELPTWVLILMLAMNPIKGNEAIWDHLRGPSRNTATSELLVCNTPPHSTDGCLLPCGHAAGMTDIELTSDQPHDSQPITSVAPRTSLNGIGDLDLPALHQQPLPPSFESYLKLQAHVTALQVQIQQLRVAASIARQELADREDDIAKALRQAEYHGVPIDNGQYQLLVARADQARNRVGPLEQEFEDVEFRLVPEEDRLIKEGRELQQSMARHVLRSPQAHANQTFASTRPSLAENREVEYHEAPTESYFEADSAPPLRPYFDLDAPNLETLVNNFAPDLAEGTHWNRHGIAEESDPLELYVQDDEELDGCSTDDEKHMGRPMIRDTCMSIPIRYQYLGRLAAEHGHRGCQHSTEFRMFRESVPDIIMSRMRIASTIRPACFRHWDLDYRLPHRASELEPRYLKSFKDGDVPDVHRADPS